MNSQRIRYSLRDRISSNQRPIISLQVASKHGDELRAKVRRRQTVDMETDAEVEAAPEKDGGTPAFNRANGTDDDGVEMKGNLGDNEHEHVTNR